MWLALILEVVLSLYFILNLARIFKGRLQRQYLVNAAGRTVLWLGTLQVLILVVALWTLHHHVNILSCFYFFTGVALLAGFILILSTIRHLRTTLAPQPVEYLPNTQLPTLSVCIPARNETKELEGCLYTLVASTYPKLEILVLDDQSNDKRTPEIIQQFAHDGVIFVGGKQPPESWLAKNYAYAQLAEVANGDIMLFCGVDTRFAPDALTTLVKTLVQKHKLMISVMPRNQITEGSGLKSLLLQPARYAWELVFPRRLLNRPPVLSTCWLITRDALRSAGGFEAVKRKIVPEAYFARLKARSGDSYSFLTADNHVGVASLKSFGEQRETAVRTRYPQLHRRLELVALLSLVQLAQLVGPLLTFILALLTSHWLLAIVAAVVHSLNATTYGLMTRLSYDRYFWLGCLVLPLAAIYDVMILNVSMWQYEFGRVVWKGRDIITPVMRANPGLVQKQ
jgi:chlorobactene glucosyltransferase